MKKRIVHIISSLSAGGAETMIMNIYRQINRENIQFDFIVHGDKMGFYYNEVISLGSKVYSVRPIRQVGMFNYFKDLICVLKNIGNIDIVHSHVDYLSGIVLLAARFCGVKKRIAHSHNSEAITHKGNLNKLQLTVNRLLINLNSTDLFACNIKASNYMFGKKSKNKTYYIKNAINLEQFLTSLEDKKRNEILNELNIDGSKKIIGNIARFVEQKNHMRIIDIFASLKLINENYILLLIGEGELKKEVEEYVNMKGLNSSIYFIGLRNDIYNILKVFNVFLLPSKFEGLPVTLIEAQAAGIYSIVSDVVSDEVDMGLGLIKFISLEQNNIYWVNAILDSENKIRKDILTRKERLIEEGYSIEHNIHTLNDVSGI